MMTIWRKIVIASMIMICVHVQAMAENVWNIWDQPEFWKQCSVEELLMLRAMIDEELANRGQEEFLVETYILNTNTVKFHVSSCESVAKIKEQNRKEYTGSREMLIAVGYAPCGNCHP